MNIRKILVLIFVLLIMLCSCEKTKTELPSEPDKIIVGANGIEIEISPDSDEFNTIYSYIRDRFEESEGFQTARLYAHDPSTGEHLSNELRQTEVYVEFAYNKSSHQEYTMHKSKNEFSTKAIETRRLFFPLSGEYHDCFFIGKDTEYKSATTLGILIENSSLQSYVRDIVTGETNGK